MCQRKKLVQPHFVLYVIRQGFEKRHKVHQLFNGAGLSIYAAMPGIELSIHDIAAYYSDETHEHRLTIAASVLTKPVEVGIVSGQSCLQKVGEIYTAKPGKFDFTQTHKGTTDAIRHFLRSIPREFVDTCLSPLAGLKAA